MLNHKLNLSCSASLLIICYDQITFLDDWRDFWSESHSVWCLYINEYTDKCMIDAFLGIWKPYYAGEEGEYSKQKSMHEICKRINCIVINNCNMGGGFQIMLTHDELYGKYISTTAKFPINVNTWSIICCPLYFNCIPSGQDGRVVVMYSTILLPSNEHFIVGSSPSCLCFYIFYIYILGWWIILTPLLIPSARYSAWGDSISITNFWSH